MKPETAQFVAFAREMLQRADQMMTLRLNDDVGRAAYLACFQVAQAVIFEREDRVLKTHKGVQTEFNRIMKDDPRVDMKLAGFVARSYKFKTVACRELLDTGDILKNVFKATERLVRRQGPARSR